MASARHLDPEVSPSFTRSSGKEATVKAIAAEPERRVGGEPARAASPLNLGKSVLGLKSYPPPAVTALLIVQAALVFAIGRVTGIAFGAGSTDFGPHELIILTAAAAYPIASIFQRSFDQRAETLAAMWGMRLIAPLAVAQLIAIALFAGIFPSLPLAQSETSLVHWIGAWFIASYVANGLLNTGFEGIVRRWETAGRLARRVVVFGGSAYGQSFIEALTEQADHRVQVLAFFDDRAKAVPPAVGDVPYLGTAEELIAFVQREHVDEIFIALPWSANTRILEVLRQFRHLPVPVRLAPDSMVLRLHAGGETAITDPSLVPLVRQPPLSPWGLFVKSATDRSIAAAILTLSSPLLLAIAVAVKLSSPGPVFFRQQRLGFNNRPFSVYKFRTMRVARSEIDTLKQATRNDPRRTRTGTFLRRTSLDELPQLLNVLRGDMSLVGPRPHPMWRNAGDLWDQGGNLPLDAIIHEYASRHRVKPGITGWAQVSGFRGETTTVDRMLKRVEHDLYYIDHWSLWFDIKILLLTFFALFKTENAY